MRAGDDWNNSYSNFPARAMPLMEVEEGSEANGWVVSTNSEACELLSRIEEWVSRAPYNKKFRSCRRVCVVAVAGQYRTGSLAARPCSV